MKQFNSNACGTIALCHLLGNQIFNPECPKDFPLFTDSSIFQKFMKKTQFMNPHERGEAFEDDEMINNIHKHGVTMNESTQSHEKVDYHFTAFANIEGLVVEFDGCKDSPKPWTQIQSTFQKDALAVIKDIVETSKFEKVTVMVLSPQ